MAVRQQPATPGSEGTRLVSVLTGAATFAPTKGWLVSERRADVCSADGGVSLP